MSESILNRKIKTLRIQNVNNHVESVFHFSPHFNLIAGTSESGKSATIRALDFALYNNYNSDLVNWNQKFAKVTLDFFDGSVLVRTKGKDTNIVEFKYPNDEAFTVYKSFGSEYPDEVKNFLGNPPTFSEGKPIAYADQFNKLFLLNEKPTQLPSIFSELTGVSDLEDCSSACNSQIKGLEKSNKSLESEIKELEEKLEADYAGLDDNITVLESLEAIINEVSELETDILGMQSYLKDYNRIKKAGKEATSEIENCKKILEELPDVNTLSRDFEALKLMKTLQNNAIKANRKIEKYDEKIRIDRGLSEGDFATKIDSCEKEFLEMQNMISMNDSAIDLFEKITKKNETIKNLKETISLNETELAKVIKEAEDVGAICSKCKKIGGEYVG